MAKFETVKCETCGITVTRRIYGKKKPGRFCSLQCRRVVTAERVLRGPYWMIRTPKRDASTIHLKGHWKRKYRPWQYEHVAVAERALGRP